MAAQGVAGGIQHLNQILADGGHVVRLRASGLDQRGRGLQQRHIHCLRTLAPLNHGIFHLRALAQRGHAGRHCGRGQEDIPTIITGDEAISFGGIKPTNSTGRHRASSLSICLDLTQSGSFYRTRATKTQEACGCVRVRRNAPHHAESGCLKPHRTKIKACQAVSAK